VANEVTIPILPCRDLDEAITFYEALGFERTFRQARPNPYAVVALEDIQIHLFGLDDFDPQQSTGNVIVAVPDPDGLYEDFAAGLRAAYGKLPSAGIPSVLRPRKKFGTVRGFSVVDPGGNWSRFSENGLARFTDAPSVVGVRALLYRAELAVRLDDRALAVTSLDEARALDLTDDQRSAVEADLAHAAELVAGLG
jgi:catechol 2,3-dioxygenase-like lactoylglutathione lyase family enzyme